MSEVQSLSFLVGCHAVTAVATDLVERNSRFVDHYDSAYFASVSSALLRSIEAADQTDRSETHRLATGMISNYGQSIEAFFAMLFAVLQAPSCPLPWLLKYRRSDLLELIRLVNENKHHDLCRVHASGSSWDGISNTINSVEGTSEIPRNDVVESFAALWRNLAKEYVDDRYSAEYNSIKHAARIEPGGFNLAIGGNPNAMHSLGGSEFGMSTQRLVNLKNTPTKHKGAVFGLRRIHYNWDPGRIHLRTSLISDSVQNVLQFARGLRAGSMSRVTFNFDTTRDVFRDASVRSLGVTVFDLDTDIEYDPSFLHDSDEVRERYRTRKLFYVPKSKTE